MINTINSLTNKKFKNVHVSSQHELCLTLSTFKYYDDEYNYCSVLSNLCIMTSIFPKFQCVTHQSSDNFSMKHVKRYFISAALIICLLYNGLFTPSNTIVQRTINIVTDTVKTVRYCDKYIVPFIINGKFSQYTEAFSLN